MDYIDNISLKKYIRETDLLAEKDLMESYEIAKQNQDSLGRVLLAKKLLKTDDLYKLYSYILGVPYVDLEKMTIDKEILNTMPLKYVEKYQILVYGRKFNSLEVAMVNPVNYEAINFLRKKTGYFILPRLTTEGQFNKTLDRYQEFFYDNLDTPEGDLSTEIENFKKNYSDLLKITQEEGVVKLLDSILKNALEDSATRIHIEPDDKELIVKYRIEEKLKTILVFPIRIAPALIGRIKFMADLDIHDEQSVQEGRFKSNNSNFLVSVFPVFEGEKVVIKIIDKQEKGIQIKDLALHKSGKEKIIKYLKKIEPGLVLVTGDKFKGKTTTMYALLKNFIASEINISTIEEKVSYSLSGVNQIEVGVNESVDLRGTLNKIINQDPDILMVDSKKNFGVLKEIFQAALTSHTVLASLETRNIQDTINWLVSSEIDNFYISGALKFIISQTLVNKLCNECKTRRKLTEVELNQIESILNVQKINKILFEEEKKEEETDKTIKDIFFYKNKGCKFCNKTGYRGKIGVHEILEFDSKQEKNAEENEDRELAENMIRIAKQNGTLTFLEDAFIKASKGLTSIDEVFLLANHA
jgi:type IV pilus assembly protein PilB